QHYAGFNINPYDLNNKFMSFFQTIDASPLLDGNGHLLRDFNIRCEISPNGAGAIGFIRLIGNVPDMGDLDPADVLAETSIPQLPGDDGLLSSPAFNAVIPAGTSWPTTNPPLLTIELRMQVNALVQQGFWVDNVLSGIYGCGD